MLPAATHRFAVAVLGAFSLVVASVVARHARTLFLPRRGRSHRLAAAAYLAWLLLGVLETCRGANRSPARVAAYDAALGVLGTVATFTAARDFGGHRASAASGTLDAKAFVTRSEMVEHAFYQGLNLLQILGLHARRRYARPFQRAAILAVQTAPWLARRRFPVNSFSKNYGGGRDPWTLVNVLYRVKKYQYVFYKHALLHGLNATNAAATSPIAPEAPFFRAYWLSLNAAYTMEFFLQTLVKRRVLAQAHMLALNKLLMAGSSAAAARVLLLFVDWRVACCSFALNMTRRGRDFSSTAVVAAAAVALKTY
jgi:hypothetical protein